ncbi:hypothetical protein RSSM_06852 [Rhodopirellula sallentina SM41]|uniref:Uncharacterized protein n=1 Tax=Rhodopirellula sallentina SM41 TaxID=1263870 RepID=M5TRE2_9BACT|nr:hypothetical protein RSSM_06852 [Rhodopirellula sallentina SM41]
MSPNFGRLNSGESSYEVPTRQNLKLTWVAKLAKSFGAPWRITESLGDVRYGIWTRQDLEFTWVAKLAKSFGGPW